MMERADTMDATVVDTVAARAFRKIALRFVPILMLAYVFNYLDRTCIGFAALTMNRDIGLTPSQFGFGAGIFFAGYCVFEVPSNMMLYRVGARRWIARIMVTWGLASAATALVTGPDSFYGARALLGVAEAGFFPGVTYFLAAWFPAQYRTRMLAWFVLGIPLSSVIGGPVCGALLQLDGVLGLAGWQWLFLVVSLPCVLIGVAVYVLLADRPREAAWLTPAEQAAVEAVLAAEVRERPRARLLDALGDVRIWILAGVQFCFTLGSYGIGIWLPLILQQGHVSTWAIGWLSSVPYVFASIGMLLWAWWVDRSGRRILQQMITCGLGAVGLGGALLAGGNVGVTLAWLTVALIGVTSARAVFWTIPTRFLTGAAAAGGLAFINMIGTMGGFAGPYMMGVLREQTGSFLTGIAAMAGVMVVAVLLAASLRLVMTRE
ncbi:MAG: MFS transporter [Acetobacteraceae bacterium]